MAKPAKGPATTKPRDLDSFFPSSAPSPSKRPTTSESSSSSPRKIARTAAQSSTPRGVVEKDARFEQGGGTTNSVETVTLDSSSSDGDGDGDDSDLVIVEPPLPSTDIKGKGKLIAKREPVNVKPAQPVAAIFAKRTPATLAASTPLPFTSAPPKVENDSNESKPVVKPSPTKTISIFDTAAAASGAHASSSSASAGTAPSKPLDTPLFSFSPSIDVSFPAPHTRTPFSFFTDALVAISGTKSRLAIQLVLTNLLRTVIEKDPQSLVAVIYLCSNRIGPSYERDTELGIGWRASPLPLSSPRTLAQLPRFARTAEVLSKAIKETSGISPQKLKQLGNKHGDPGDIAFEASKSVRLLVQPAPLECHGVYRTLLQIAKLKGWRSLLSPALVVAPALPADLPNRSFSPPSSPAPASTHAPPTCIARASSRKRPRSSKSSSSAPKPSKCASSSASSRPTSASAPSASRSSRRSRARSACRVRLRRGGG